MKVKVPFFSQRVARQYAAVVAILSAISSFFFISISIPDGQKPHYLMATVVSLIILYLVIWIRANLKTSARLNINNSSLVVKVGDIFKEDGLKGIAFNEYLDTQVDDVVIARATLNGTYLSRFTGTEIAALDAAIASDARLADRQVEAVSGRQHGKTLKYKLGSVFVNDEYLLVAFSHFDENNRANLTLKQYVSCMLNFWDEVDQVYAGRSVSIPLMGSGMTRFKDTDVPEQDLLKILIWTFKISRVKFKHPAKATIVIHKSMSDKINFNDLG